MSAAAEVRLRVLMTAPTTITVNGDCVGGVLDAQTASDIAVVLMDLAQLRAENSHQAITIRNLKSKIDDLTTELDWYSK